jgi:WD40 repeat protein
VFLIWDRATLTVVRKIKTEWTQCLADWEGRLVSGHRDGTVRIWNVETGECEQELKKHRCRVVSLLVWGKRLVSGSLDSALFAWTMSDGGECTCINMRKTNILNQLFEESVFLLWRNQLLFGTSAGLEVWSMHIDGTCASKLIHLKRDSNWMTAMTASDGHDRLFTASRNGRLHSWARGTFASLRSVQAYDANSAMHISCLAMSGSRLVSGSSFEGTANAVCEVRVWDAETLACEHVLVQPARMKKVVCMVSIDGGLWAVVDGPGKVVVWGWKEASAKPDTGDRVSDAITEQDTMSPWLRSVTDLWGLGHHLSHEIWDALAGLSRIAP